MGIRMKTIKEHYQELPEPYKTEAFKNLRKDNENIKVDNINKAICGGFIFAETPQGLDYWFDFLDKNYPNKQ